MNKVLRCSGSGVASVAAVVLCIALILFLCFSVMTTAEDGKSGLAGGNAEPAAADPPERFSIRVVDAQSGRGIPLAELETTVHTRHVTDSAGYVALGDPYMMNQIVFFYVKSHGYEEPPVDFIGFRGIRPKVVPGGEYVLKLNRINIAERLYRFTGGDIYRDSLLLGKPAPIMDPTVKGQVLSHDSLYAGNIPIYEPMLNAQAVVYRGKVFWLFGATQGLRYLSKNMRMTAATSDLPENGGLRADEGIDLKYFVDKDGFVKEMCPFGEEGDVIWVEGAVTLPDKSGRERLVVYYRRFRDWERESHGLAVFNDDKEIFEELTVFDPSESWRMPRGRSFRHIADDGKEWFYFGNPFPNVRVPADFDSLIDPSSYEAWSCLAEGVSIASQESDLMRDSKGKIIYRWTKDAPPVGQDEEVELYYSDFVDDSEAYFLPVDAESGISLFFQSGSVRWNPWRERWILIAVEEYGNSSTFGEVWYSEAESPTGPWRKAVKIATHDKYSFFNPIHHDFFDQDGGREIFFEGTYSDAFSNIPHITPLYNNNRIMYRLDLSDPGLDAVR